MTKSELLAYMTGSETLNAESAVQLKKMVHEFPYFQTAHLLLAKNRYLTDPETFEKSLSRTAAFCADRRRLFYLINSEKYTPFEKAEPNVDSDRTQTLLDSFLTNFAEQQQQETEYGEDNIVSTDYLTYIQNFEPEDEGETKDQPDEQAELKHQDIIDSFLEKAETNEIMFTPALQHTDRPAQPETESDGGGFLTETLARIYIKQKKYEQALAIIQQLSLNFPKKSAYFADQIRFLELLILNEKNKKQ